jgi:tRNA threonylcarbamoyladenosine biosynthesis protein TsaB
VVAPEALIDTLAPPVLFVGSGARLYRERLTARLGGGARFPAEDRHVVHGSAVGELALSQLRQGAPGDVSTLVPSYLRKSDAEMNRKGPGFIGD